MALGDRERAMALLRELGYESFLHTEFELEPLWDYPGFRELAWPNG